MGYLDYYKYQATARGVRSVQDVYRIAHEKAYVYDRIVLPWLPADKNSPIAELACGHGSFLAWLKEQQFQKLVGADSSAEQIQFARQIGAEVFETDFKSWLASEPDSSREAIVAIDLIEHISKDEFMDLLGDSSRVLARGGRLILRYPNGDSPLVGRNLFNDITHVWTYTTNCIETLGRMHGFSRFDFVDESSAAIRDSRWLKVPLSKLGTGVLKLLFRAATKEQIDFWSPHIWAALQK
ncbi:MAG TPA: class I SAM-dependent methyltransferase [Verrucomicrobiae bacterium]|nr:class I SAM-dependent methyltransferase [Verrucomicrobiae bacterium]